MEAVVYTSNTGHTKAYAWMIADKMDLGTFELREATKELEKGTPIVYFGWLCANTIKGYKKASKYFDIKMVCAVGLCDTGTAIDAVRKANSIPEDIPVFTLQGGMDKTKLHGINKFMIKTLIKVMESKKDKTEEDTSSTFISAIKLSIISAPLINVSESKTCEPMWQWKPARSMFLNISACFVIISA